MKKSSRRSAIKKIALGAGATALGMPNVSGFDFRPVKKEKLGVALVGLGNYATLMLGPAFAESQNCYLAGIVTGTPTKAEKWSKQYNIPRKNIYNYETFDQIADNEDIDIVYIVLPNFMHAEFTIRAAQAGKHVICEKPMALNSEECKAMINACQENDRLLSIGYRLHFEKHHQEMMRLGKELPFGPLNLVEASLGYHLADKTLWRLDKKKGGGGAIMDLGVYAIQGARYVVGEAPVRVMAQGFLMDDRRFKDIYETILWQMEFPSGTLANCSTTYSSYVDRLYASCYRGWFGLNPSFGGRGSSGSTSKGPMNLPQINQQAAQMDDFAECIWENRPSRVSGDEGLADLIIIEAILESCKSGKPVDLI